jgi:ABC-type sulfate/molybdate transport systems ATPase subunit
VSLDAKLRVQMRTTVARPQNQLGTATVYVTHDHTEAMTTPDGRSAGLEEGEHGQDPAVVVGGLGQRQLGQDAAHVLLHRALGHP